MYVIKQIPEDFIVREVTKLKKEAGKYGLYLLWKKNLTTHEALDIIRQKIRLSQKQIGFAGLKDKKAVTEQYITLTLKNKLIDEENIKLSYLGETSQNLGKGELKENEFEIVVRNLENEMPNEKKWMINYFDEQRFSEYNVEIGREIIKKNFSKALEVIEKSNPKLSKIPKAKDAVARLNAYPRRLLKIYVHAYQAWLWNEAVFEYLEKYDCEKIKYSKGIFAFPKKKVEAQIDLPGFDSGEKHYEKIFAKEGITNNDFIIRQIPYLTAEAVQRDMTVEIRNLKISQSIKDELNAGRKKVKLEFVLPKGSYATITLRALFLY